jgi:TM2 domain-containing membrane protein YozV
LTTLVWIIVTFATAAESNEILLSFYRKVRPDVRGWKPVAALTPEVAPTRDLGRNLLAWLLGCGMVYAALFGVGKLILLQPGAGVVLLLISALCALLLYRDISRRSWHESEPQRETAAQLRN